ncbi:MAG: hypothetical protein KU28_04315 [Sulfurovum sp. PC08-66]|nr:MAG: hypothetical protein KU28_04315 [Sulfurovum sp. PC08-66]
MKLLVLALEPSSNLHLKELLKYTHDIEMVGIFSKELGTPLYDVSDVAIMGFVDAFKKYRWFKRVALKMVELARDVDRVLLMDSSGFNLPLAQKIKEAYPSKEIVYYILPQTWATMINLSLAKAFTAMSLSPPSIEKISTASNPTPKNRMTMD